MAGSPSPNPASGGASRNLIARAIAALVMIPIALALVWAGGWWWSGVAILISAGLFTEWATVVNAANQRLAIAVGLCGLLVSGLLAGSGLAGFAICAVIVTAIASAGFASASRVWLGLGVVYSGTAQIASILVRDDDSSGVVALLFVLLIVWVTDIGGYFFGKGLGGPKLAPRVSPNKTWAGAIGGVMLSGLVAFGFILADVGSAVLIAVALVLTVSSQIGDLVESAVKRRFGVKDSGSIIPGHGGLLDRLDGFVFAIAVGAMIGFLRDGADGVGRGLMMW